MSSGDYAVNSQGYVALYPQTVLESDSQESTENIKKSLLCSSSQAKHFNCFCGRIFTSKADFDRHVLVHTGERPHECNVCGKTFTLKGNLTKHMLLHTEEKTHHCTQCEKSFLKKSYLDQHMLVHTGERPHECSICNKTFALKGNLTKHMEVHTDEKSFHCPICGKAFLKKCYVDQHMLIHSTERPHECETCGKAFSLKGNLTKHMMLHSEEAHHCPECGKTFMNKMYIEQHMRIHTGERPYECQYCKRSFSLESNLKQHMKLHTDEKSYHCLVCNKLFQTRSYLMQHMRIHSGQKPHKCTLCDKAFILKGNLRQHLQRHSGCKPFKCLLCGKAFALKSALKEHEKIHAEEKPFVCIICSKAFTKKEYLTQHERTHTGERPFHCMECGKSFSQRSILNQHMKQHGERSYKCKQCHKIFLKKLSDIYKCLQMGPFSGFNCSDCGGDGQFPGVFMKQEQQVVNTNSLNIVQENNLSLNDSEDIQKDPQEMEKMQMIKMQMGVDFIESSDVNVKQNDFDMQLAPADSANLQKFAGDHQKKGLMSKNHNGAVEELQSQGKKGEASYTELKIAEKCNPSDGIQSHVNVGNTVYETPNMVEKHAASSSQYSVCSQKQSSSEHRKLDSFAEVKPTIVKGITNHIEYPHASTIEDLNTSAPEKSIEKVNHQSLKSKKTVPPRQPAPTQAVMEGSEVSRTLAALPDYCARPVDFRYLENFRDPFQRNLTNLRQGNMFGIKGYYNTSWPLPGNYPQ